MLVHRRLPAAGRHRTARRRGRSAVGVMVGVKLGGAAINNWLGFIKVFIKLNWIDLNWIFYTRRVPDLGPPRPHARPRDTGPSSATRTAPTATRMTHLACVSRLVLSYLRAGITVPRDVTCDFSRSRCTTSCHAPSRLHDPSGDNPQSALRNMLQTPATNVSPG